MHAQKESRMTPPKKAGTLVVLHNVGTVAGTCSLYAVNVLLITEQSVPILQLVFFFFFFPLPLLPLSRPFNFNLP